MAITRQDLEADRLRASLDKTPVASTLLSDEALDRSVRAALQSRPRIATAGAGHDDRHSGDVWLFGYGSLIWNPMVVHTERRVATVHGYHRGFYLYSRINRGTWDRPGLVLGLDRGGSCHGMVFRIPEAVLEQEFRVLWRREMMTGAYHPRWLRVKLAGEPTPQRALAFVMNRSHEAYAGRLPDEQIVGCLQHACGLYGPARDYLHQTVLGLATHGLDDPYLSRLWRQIQAADALAAQARSADAASGSGSGSTSEPGAEQASGPRRAAA